MWIVTMDINDYNQYGDYFVAAYLEKPNFSELKSTLTDECLSDATLGKLSRGGGRANAEDKWYNLREYK